MPVSIYSYFVPHATVMYNILLSPDELELGLPRDGFITFFFFFTSYFPSSSVSVGCLYNQWGEKRSQRGCFSAENQLNALNLSLEKPVYPLVILGA